ncbi:amino acid ABC transporter permease [Paraburkholderia kirstenboschensis]|uniref:Amino acid ABC transporter permease n=1 Tax=Paraburkholderia kirstenboschensis TaxID=1245436 RepID=A0ABZ0E879_9BURK|nr:amino acid ABC transporter permease [Paraburkholderia kirstenboschensis]WOD13411.1 amino acid ABC transporter permease [Paraburkholderia kirstenboschensis]
MEPMPEPAVAQPRPPPWNDPRIRAIVFQVLVSAGVIALGVYLVRNLMHNLEVRGISTGFGFLSNRAGFAINQSLIPYSEETSTYGRTFVVGLLNTLLVSGLGIVCSTILGFIVGVARLSRNWLVAKLALAYIEIFRNLPLLVQILFWYFAVFLNLPPPSEALHVGDSVFITLRGLYLPRPEALAGFEWTVVAFFVAIVASVVLARWSRRRQERTGKRFPAYLACIVLLVGVPLAAFVLTGRPLQWVKPELAGFNFVGGIALIPELAALLMSLSIYTAAFIAETVRAGILSVSHGQTEAASALGLRPSLTLRLVVIPQAMRVTIPPLTSQYLNLTKNSSLATAIGYPDLVSLFAGTTLNQTGQAVEVMSMTMAVYLAISFVISLFMNWYNARMALVER